MDGNARAGARPEARSEACPDGRPGDCSSSHPNGRPNSRSSRRLDSRPSSHDDAGRVRNAPPTAAEADAARAQAWTAPPRADTSDSVAAYARTRIDPPRTDTTDSAAATRGGTRAAPPRTDTTDSAAATRGGTRAAPPLADTTDNAAAARARTRAAPPLADTTDSAAVARARTRICDTAVALGARRLVVAFSGGADSTALLELACAAAQALQPPRALLAAHVNHGLDAGAEAREAHCRAHAARRGTAFVAARAHAAPRRGESPEAAARAARYRALEALLLPGDLLLAAHHRDDQAETLLLQLLRGAGPAGLAAMPELKPCGRGHLLRPLLDIPRAALRAFARAQGLDWVEDPSNDDARYDRNYLRNAVGPALARRWPAWGATLARAAQHQADAREIVERIARRRVAACIAACDAAGDRTGDEVGDRADSGAGNGAGGGAGNADCSAPSAADRAPPDVAGGPTPGIECFPRKAEPNDAGVAGGPTPGIECFPRKAEPDDAGIAGGPTPGVERAAQSASEPAAELAAKPAAGSAATGAAALSARALAALPAAEARAALRVWLADAGLGAPAAAQLARILRCLETGVAGGILARWAGGEVRAYRGALYALAPAPPAPAPAPRPWPRGAALEVPELGLRLAWPRLVAQAPELATASDVSVRFRTGGERCPRSGGPGGRDFHRSLKKVFQELGVPPWRRARIPLIYAGARLRLIWELAAFR